MTMILKCRNCGGELHPAEELQLLSVELLARPPDDRRRVRIEIVEVALFVLIAQSAYTNANAKLLLALRTLEHQLLPVGILSFVEGDVIIALRTTDSLHLISMTHAPRYSLSRWRISLAPSLAASSVG